MLSITPPGPIPGKIQFPISKNWNANFKLHAPLNTTIEGVVRDGKVESLTVTPPERKADLVLLESKN